MDEPREAREGWQLLALGSAFFAALTAVLGKVGVSEISPGLATFIRTVVVIVVAALLVTIRGEWQVPGDLSRLALVMLILSGVATGLSWICYYNALAMAPASRVAFIDKASVALVAVLAVAFLGEPLTWKLAVGGGLVLAGVYVLAS
jgi:transporter family protein